MELNGNYYIFFRKFDKKNVVESLHYMEINFDAGTVGSTKRLLKVSGKVMYGFSFTSSHNGDKLLVRYRKKPTKKNDKLSTDVIGMNVYTAELDEVWSEEVKMPYTEAE